MKSLLLLGLFCFSFLLSIAQEKTVSGQVMDANGAGIPFATVTETGTQNSTRADLNGKFSLKLKNESTLTITAIGYEDITITPGVGPVTASLIVKASELKEVIVTTAFGIKKAARVTPYSAQVIQSEQLNLIPQTNLNSALAGKVAGAQFRGQSLIKLDNQGALRIRGGLGLGDASPIYVVDGTIVNSFDINPDDVENISILKGANATALFGGRAKNGAVVINTKKRGDKNVVGIEFNQGVTVDKIYVLPNYQNTYAGGASSELTQFAWRSGMPIEWQALDGKFFHDYTDDASWGPRMAGQEYIPWYAWAPGHSRSFQSARLLPQPDNARDFWETGITTTSNLSFTKSKEGLNTRISYTNNYLKGLLPNASSERHTLFATLSNDLNERFSVGANVNFTNQKIKGTFDDAYANQSSGSFNQWFHRNLDMGIMKELRGLLTPIGTYMSWNTRSNPDAGVANTLYRANYWYNFYTWFDELDYTQVRERLFGDIYLSYKPINGVTLKTTVRKNLFVRNYEDITPSILQSSGIQTQVLADYSTGELRIDEMNYEFLGSYYKKLLNKLDIALNAGVNLLKIKNQSVDLSTSGGLNTPNLYSISNSVNQPASSNARIQEQQRSFFANGEFEWDKYVSLSWAVRTDLYSALAKGNNRLTSPALGASFIFSEFTKDAISWLSFGKVFGSWGKKPTALLPYANNFLYSINPNQINGNFLMTTPNSLVDPSVKGSLVTTIEAGVDLKFLKNRIGINFTYYFENNEKEPVTVTTSGISGFTTKVINAAHVKREGLEVQLTAKPLAGKNFDWDITKTFSYIIKNPVIALSDGQNRILLAGGAFGTRFARAFQEVGKDWGQLIGGGIKRNENGQPLLTQDGLFVSDPDKHWGSVVPKINGGLVNTFTYKSFIFNFTLDYQVGGKFFSLSESWGHYSGLLEATAAINDKGMNVRDDVLDGGGVHVVGVSVADGRTPVDMYVDAQTYWHQFYGTQIAEPFIHDLTYVKLREISVGYHLPVQKMKIGKVFKGITVSAVSRNPWLIYREAKSFDPSEISAIQGEDGQFPGTRSVGLNLKLNF